MVLTETLTYVAVLFVVIVSLWTIVAYPKNYLFKIFFIPLFLFVAISVFETYNSILGYATTANFNKQMQYYYHVVEGDRVYILLRGDRGDPRLYTMEYHESYEEELEKMKQKSMSGITTFGAFAQVLARDAEINRGDWIIYEMPFQDIIKKED